MDKNKIPENLRPITDHMVEYDGRKHDIRNDALLVYIDREAFDARGYEIEAEGMLGYMSGGCLRPFGGPGKLLAFSVYMGGHMLVFENKDTEDAKDRKRVEALESAPTGSLAVYYPSFGYKLFVRKAGNGSWQAATGATFDPQVDDIQLFEDDTKDVIPKKIDDLNTLVGLIAIRGNSLASFHYEDKDGDMWRYDPKENQWSWNQHPSGQGREWSGWSETARPHESYFPLIRKPISSGECND